MDNQGLAPVVVRVAGLPVHAVTGLRGSRSAALVDELVAGDGWLRSEGSTLADILHDLIANAPAALKPRLVGLRRALYRARRPARHEWDAEVAAGLPAEVHRRVGRWLWRLHQLRELRQRLPHLLAADAARSESALRDVAADPAFRRALWQSSRTLSAELDKWLREPHRRPKEQVLARLAKYVARAATKTSPYSTFTISGFGAWTANGPMFRLADGWHTRTVLELHAPIRDGLRDRLAREPAVSGTSVVRVNASATVDRDRVCFLGRPPAEPLVTLPRTPALRHCLDLLDSGEEFTLDELRKRLMAADAGATETKVARFLGHLVDSGLLTMVPPVARPDAFRELAAWSATSDGARLAEVAGLLRETATELDRSPPVADVSGFVSRHTSLRTTVGALAAHLDLPDRTGADALVAMDVAVASGTLGECGTGRWRCALEDLQALQRWLCVFSPTLPTKLLAAELWRERFTPATRVPFLLLHRAVQQEIASGSVRGEWLRRATSPWRGLPDATADTPRALRELGRLRDAAEAPIRSPPGADGIVRIDPEVLADPVSELPPWVDPLGSVGCYVQPLDSGGGNDSPAVVLNTVDIGYGRGRNRVAYLVHRARGTPPTGQTWMSPRTEPVLAELAGSHGSTLNDRLPGLPYQIEYPFTASNPPSPHPLPLSDLLVEYDPARGRLRAVSARSGDEIRVLTLGTMSPLLLPPAARLLAYLFGESHTSGSPWRPRSRSDPPAGVQYLPRVEVGVVVLWRAAWLADLTEVPRRRPGEHDSDFLLRLAEWRREAGIPRRCFARVVPADRDQPALVWLTKAHKPVYLDFDSLLLVRGFENMTRPVQGTLALEEALPDPGGGAAATGPARVAELLVEITRPAGDQTVPRNAGVEVLSSRPHTCQG